MGCDQKIFKLVWWCHNLLSAFLAKGHLPRVSSQSVNDKGDNEKIPGVVHRYPGSFLTAEENPGEPQLGDRRSRLWDQSSPKMGSLTSKMRSVGCYSKSGKKMQGKKERTC